MKYMDDDFKFWAIVGLLMILNTNPICRLLGDVVLVYTGICGFLDRRIK